MSASAASVTSMVNPLEMMNRSICFDIERLSLVAALAIGLPLSGCATAVHRPGAVAPRGEPSAEAITDSVRAVLLRGLADSAYPGAYAIVGSRSKIYASLGVGHLDWELSARPDENTMWDMASLSKVIGTTTAVMQLRDEGKLNLFDPVQKYIPEFAGKDKELVTVKHLLTHSSGLPSGRPLWREARTPEEGFALAFQTPLDTVPGARMLYSDLSMIIMGKIVERISGETLDGYLALHVFGPLGMTSTMYRPPEWMRQRIAPTERKGGSGELVYGHVHDENAYSLGGVAGHAGLFSTAHDLAIFARMYLNGGIYDSVRVVSEEAVQAFTRVQDSTLSRRALGWETPTDSNSAGMLLSSHAFGHTGFTGTSIWMDPDRDLFIILLSNRVNPTRERRRIYTLRGELADAVAEAEDASMGIAIRPRGTVAGGGSR